MHDHDYASLSIAEITESIAIGDLRASAICRHFLERIDILDAGIHSFTDVIADAAMADALRVDAMVDSGEVLPPLAGVPVAIKDLIDVTPARCSAGLPFLRDYRPTKDAAVVDMLRDAGAVVLGVLQCDPGAFDVRTMACRHPHESERVVGGSSGGSGAAVAGGLTMASIGTDTGGSIRIPAACCGVVGFKPSFGRVPTAGVRPLAWSLDHVGPLARCVDDVYMLQQVIDPSFKVNPEVRVRKQVLGIDEAYFADAREEVKAGVHRALEAARSLGWEIRKVTLPTPESVGAYHMINLSSEAAAYHLTENLAEIEDYPQTARETLSLAETQTGYDYVNAQRQRAAASAQVDALFGDVDLLLAPTLPVLTPTRDQELFELGGREIPVLLTLIRYTALFDQTGHPALALPVDNLAPGITTSVQLVGPRHHDRELLAQAASLEHALGRTITYGVRHAAST